MEPIRHLDDWLILSYSEVHASQCTALVVQLATELGIVFNAQKSSLVPSQVSTYMGMVIDTARLWVSPKPERITKFLPILQSFLSFDRWSALSWQVLLGYMTSLEMFVPGGRLRTRSAQFCLADHWDRVLGPEVLVPVTEGVKYDLLWWSGQGRLARVVCLRDVPFLSQ